MLQIKKDDKGNWLPATEEELREASRHYDASMHFNTTCSRQVWFKEQALLAAKIDFAMKGYEK